MKIQPIFKVLKWSVGIAFVAAVIYHMSVPEGFVYLHKSQESDLRPISEFKNDTERLQTEIKRLEGELQAIEFVLTKSQQEPSFRTLVQQSYITKRGRMEELKSLREFAVQSLRK